MSAYPKAKYKDLKFLSDEDFKAWLLKYEHAKIELEDNGQDLQVISVDKNGEIINTNAQQTIWLGSFIDLKILNRDMAITMYNDTFKRWRETDFIPEKVTYNN